MDVKIKRNANIELLRIISMLMVVMLHALGKGNNLVSLLEGPSLNKVIAWIFEALSISAVNIFVLISGYFLVESSFKVRRLLGLVCECLFYTMGSFGITRAFGIETGVEVNTYNFFNTIMPIHMELYWFMTVYIFIYMLQPILAKGMRCVSQKEFERAIIILLIYECLIKSVLPVRVMADKAGYNLQWLLIVFTIGAYFRLYGFRWIKNVKKGFTIYGLFTFLILLESGAIGIIINRTGRLRDLSLISMSYNHIFVLMSAVGIFAAFINMRPMGKRVGSVICKLSPMSLGVYLFHENLPLRQNWPKWLGIYKSVYLSTPLFLGKLIFAVISMYVIGTVIDFVRIKIFSIAGKVVAKRKEA